MTSRYRSRSPAYITKLPKAEHATEPWQAAMEALLLVAEHGGPTMFARIGVMRALNRHVERVFKPGRKEPALGTAEAGTGSVRVCLIARLTLQ